jgi:hypothetical protein
MEQIAYFWEQEDAQTVADRFGGVVRRGRFQGEDDDEDHPWIVILRDVDPAAADELVHAHDGWLETAEDAAAAPPPLPSEPKRFKKA